MRFAVKAIYVNKVEYKKEKFNKSKNQNHHQH